MLGFGYRLYLTYALHTMTTWNSNGEKYQENSVSNEVTDFLKNFASTNGYTVFSELSGEISFGDSQSVLGKETKTQFSSGSVYGFFAIKTNVSSETELFKEIGIPQCLALDSEASIYPLYWGKGINPCVRIQDHVCHRASTNNNARLEEIAALRHFKVIFGSIYVARYKSFEQDLHKNFPPLIGSAKGGKDLGKYTSMLF
jgi:hypothetical protein